MEHIYTHYQIHQMTPGPVVVVVVRHVISKWLGDRFSVKTFNTITFPYILTLLFVSDVFTEGVCVRLRDG